MRESNCFMCSGGEFQSLGAEHLMACDVLVFVSYLEEEYTYCQSKCICLKKAVYIFIPTFKCIFTVFVEMCSSNCSQDMCSFLLSVVQSTCGGKMIVIT